MFERGRLVPNAKNAKARLGGRPAETTEGKQAVKIRAFIFITVKYCAVAVCTNSDHKKGNLSYFRFSSGRKICKKWKLFDRS